MPRYVVTSKHEVLGHKPGEVFEAELLDGLGLLVGVGHLALAPEQSAPVPQAPPVQAAPPVPVKSADEATTKAEEA